MAQGIARIRLDDGTSVWARVSGTEELDRGSGFQDTGFGDRVVSMAGGLTDVVRGVVGSLRAGLTPEGPVEVAVSFGIELSAQAGKVIGVLADGGGTASVNVSLTWTEPGRRAAAEAAAAAAAAAREAAGTVPPAPGAPPGTPPTPVPAPAPPPLPSYAPSSTPAPDPGSTLADPTASGIPAPPHSPENGPGAV
ncbi:CU044_2847 family protein [Streptomyces sp. NPDC048718]|uniref:CU044_2847 family protein n=1 Tax=Streptomyces sp. NPDC048718 TaxID=3365587 RepID=UPI0037144E11